MVIRLRRLPMPLRVLCVLLAVLLLAGTVFAPVARAEALTATIALFGGAALVSGVLAAAGLKASDSAAWNSWCSRIAASDSVRSAAQALTKITLPAAKLVALVYAGKTYVSKAVQKAIINEAITAGAYVAGSTSVVYDDTLKSALWLPNLNYEVHVVSNTFSCSGYMQGMSQNVKQFVSSVDSSSPVYILYFGSDTSNQYSIRAFSLSNFRLRDYCVFERSGIITHTYNSSSFRTKSGLQFYSCGVGSCNIGGSYPCPVSLPPYYANESSNYYRDFAAIIFGGTMVTTGGIDGVTQQDGAISDPIGKDVIGSLDDLKTKVTDWSDYLDTGVDVAIDGAAEGVASEAVPSLPVTIPTTGQQGAQTYPDARTGTTDSTVVDTGTSTATAAENQGVVSKLLSDVLDYLKPDTGFWDKFPLCIPYDMYLFVASLSGKDMSDSSIFSATPGSLSSTAAVDVQSADNWQPVINIDQDWQVSGVNIPWHFTLDLTPFLPLFDLIRLFVGASFVIGLYWYEWSRIKEDS